MEITLQYFGGCPNWETTSRHLQSLLDEGLQAVVRFEAIDSHETAVEKGFCGSPTVLINGVDPFPDPNAQPGLACRMYPTGAGPAGSPTLGQLRRAVTAIGT